MNTAGWCRRLGRLMLVGGLVTIGMATSLCVLPFCRFRTRQTIKARWSACLIRVLGIRIAADLQQLRPGAMLVANHISWVDVFIINAVLPTAFVAKSEVRRWPLFGWLAAKNDTIFMQRGNRCAAHTTNDIIADRLARGRHVAIFPEGTTTDGRSIRHFHAALLQAAVQSGQPVVPLALSYWHDHDERSLAPRYDGSISFLQCLLSIAAQKRTTARLTALPALGFDGEDRRHLALAARHAIAAEAGLMLAERSDADERTHDNLPEASEISVERGI